MTFSEERTMDRESNWKIVGTRGARRYAPRARYADYADACRDAEAHEEMYPDREYTVVPGVDNRLGMS